MIHYKIRDQLTDELPHMVPYSEEWLTGVSADFSGANWRRIQPNGNITDPADARDEIQGEASANVCGIGDGGSGTNPYFPTANINGALSAVQHWGQGWRVGSVTSGIGQTVQTDVLKKYINHAEHIVP
jgi:hypothetical protein